MIGINSQIESPSGASAGVGFAIPVSIAKRIVPQLIRDGEIRRPKLGIAPRDVASLGQQLQLPVKSGVLIVSVAPGSPAANAGLRGVIQTEDGDLEVGDIIVGIDGQKVDNNDDLFKILDKHKIGDSVSVEVFRQGRQTSVPVRLTEIPAQRRNARE
jgi:S1-C subfamily serine protease